MGKGIDLAREDSPEYTDMLDDLKDQLLIVFLKRMGGRASFAVQEVDDTQQDLMTMAVANGIFHFEIKKKS